MTRARLPHLLLLLVLAAAAPASAWETTYGLRFLPFTGVVVPHQQISDFDPSFPLGLGLEIGYTERFSFVLDIRTSWHEGDGNEDLQLSALQLLGRWRFPDVRWNPFVEAGLGGYQADVDNGGKTQYGGIGAAFGAGFEYPLGRSFFLEPDVRFNWSQGEENQHHDDLWISHTEAVVRLVYRLP